MHGRLVQSVVIVVAGACSDPAPAHFGMSQDAGDGAPDAATTRPGPDTGPAEPSGRPPSDAAPADRPSAEPAATFRLLTYNVAGLPELLNENEPERTIPLISPLLNMYDLVLVQEDFSYHEELVAEASHPFQSDPHPDSGDGGSAIGGVGGGYGDGLNRLSMFPFEGHQRVAWNECHGWFGDGSDCLTSKGYSVAVHQLGPGAFVHVYNLHMDAARGDEDQEVRGDQIDQIMAAIEMMPGDVPLIIAGDTNLKEEDEEWLLDWVERGRLQDACRVLDCPRPELHDRVLFRSGREVELVPMNWITDPVFVDEAGMDLSDHKAVGVEMAWQLI